MPAARREQEVTVSYGPEGRSALYAWHRRMQTRLGNAVLLWMGRRYRTIPERAGYRMGSAIGTLIRYISPRHHGIVMRNLRVAFGGERSEQQLSRIAAGCYRHLGKCLIEFIRLPAMSPTDITAGAMVQGREHIDDALAAGSGAILLTGHLGNWEMVGARLAVEGYKMNVIARAQRDDALTEYIRSTREVAGMRVLHQEVAVRGALRALRGNELVGILLDQNAGDDGIFVDFFGHLASTAAGAAVFALRTHAAVLPTFGWRNPDNRHCVVIDPPVPLIETGDREHDIRENTARYTKIIEQKIREHPEQWFWLHKRWKSRPPGERRG